MKEFIFKPELDDKGDVDRVALKKALGSLLGDRVEGDNPNYLFSAEPLHTGGGFFRLRVLDGTIPSAPMKEIEVQTHSDGDEIIVSAYVALKDKAFRKGNTRDALADHCKERLTEMCEQHFADLMTIESINVDNIRVMKARSHGHDVRKPYGHVTVTGVVRDPDGLLALQKKGIGQAKAYGFGLIASKNIH